ncbi:prenyltransferase and squalene oxidase repeat-containing domain protein, partial [Teladorsagia circumcincta]
MCYWGLHSLNILGVSLPHNQKAEILAFLKTCQHPDGGFGGGPGQYAHLAPTYASVMALASLQTEDALAAINLDSLSRFLHRMKQPDGSFTMHDGGEADIRGTYCALAVAALCGIMTDKLRDGAAEWVIKCQTYEGGFGGEPFTEAHGGYAFCGVASLVILDRYRLADSELLLQWLSKRQMPFEGGFQGRTNKLVDGCYSFWQAANFPLIDGEMAREGRLPTEGLFDARMLEEYILLCCQVCVPLPLNYLKSFYVISFCTQDEAGGFRDKPDKSRDLYHTCYVLSGLAVAQAYSATREPDGILGGAQNSV